MKPLTRRAKPVVFHRPHPDDRPSVTSKTNRELDHQNPRNLDRDTDLDLLLPLAQAILPVLIQKHGINLLEPYDSRTRTSTAAMAAELAADTLEQLRAHARRVSR